MDALIQAVLETRIGTGFGDSLRVEVVLEDALDEARMVGISTLEKDEVVELLAAAVASPLAPESEIEGHLLDICVYSGTSLRDILNLVGGKVRRPLLHEEVAEAVVEACRIHRS